MVFLSTYKSSRVLAREALKAPVLRHRAMQDWLLARPWAGSLNGLLFGDARWFLAVGFLIYYIQRTMQSLKCDEDNYQRILINRWGGTVEAVRENLTPQDQARARAYIQTELFQGPLGDKTLFTKPEGMDLPGPAALPGRPPAH